MAIKFGLTNRGYIAPTFAEWLDDIEDDFRSRFGDDIVITSNSNFGILARIFAWRLTEISQQMEYVYNFDFYLHLKFFHRFLMYIHPPNRPKIHCMIVPN